MSEPNSDLSSKLNRAIRAVLLSAGAGLPTEIIAAPNSTERTLPNTDIVAGDAIPFDGPGNWQFPSVTITLRDDAAVQPGETNSAVNRVSANDRLTKVFNALNRSDDTHTLYYTAQQLTALGRALAVDASSGSDDTQAQDAANNADMAEFTVLWWEFVGIGSLMKVSTDSGGTFWQRDLTFSCFACNSALS